MRHAPCRLPRYLLGAVAVLAVALPGRGTAMPLVGNAQTVVREVLGVLDTAEQTIYVDSEVFQDEDIVTGPKSATRIIFKDGTNLEMGENSRLRLTKLVFDPDPAKSRVVVKAAIGVFRWTSGNLPHESYEISTPVATIGVRGTTIELIVAESGLTTAALARGAIRVFNKKGEFVDLKPGEATTVLPPDDDGDQPPPSAPGPLAMDVQGALWTMTVMIRTSDPPSDIMPRAGGPQGGNRNYFSNIGNLVPADLRIDPPLATLSARFPPFAPPIGPPVGPSPPAQKTAGNDPTPGGGDGGTVGHPDPGSPGDPGSPSDPGSPGDPSGGGPGGPPTTIGEPMSLALLGIGLGGLALGRSRRQRRDAGRPLA